ncbi:SDR family NAD(P)-dependent oxidoreductase, partial [Micrococcus sp. SIMBA_131]
DYAAVEAAFQRASTHFGSLDVLICNAGMIEPIARLEHAEPADWAQLINVNITGVFNMMRAGLPHLKVAGGGAVLTIGSGASQRPL